MIYMACRLYHYAIPHKAQTPAEVNLFVVGKETPVDLELDQVETVKE